ncbi:MAG: helix-turn-helix domain-containing protein [Cyanobacteria bacterium J06638_20]
MTRLEKQRIAARLYQQGRSPGDIAKELDVSERTIFRWAAAGDWDKGRTQREEKVIDFARAHSKEPVRPESPKTDRELDDLTVINAILPNLKEQLGDEALKVNSPGVGASISALIRMLEYRRKIQPPTARDLAEVAIALNISPQEFMDELQKQWQLQA